MDIPNPEEKSKTLIPLDPDQFPTRPGLRHLMPKEIKKEVRKEWHWFLWLTQHTYAEIEEITGYERTTIWEDLKEVQQELSKDPINHESTRQLALMQMRFLAAEIITRARETKNDNSAAKLYAEAADIQKTILERYTQAGGLGETTPKETIDKVNALAEFMIERFGAESLDNFEAWYSKRQVAKAAMKTLP